MKKYQAYLNSLGYTNVASPNEAEYIIIWTCSFRNDVKNMSTAVVDHFTKEYSDKKIIVAGCMPTIYPEIAQQLANLSNVIVAPWKQDECSFPEIFADKTQKDIPLQDIVYVEPQLTNDLELFRKNNPESNVMFCDQFIKVVISEGCNEKCSYCSERFAFPAYRSHSIKTIVHQCEEVINSTHVYQIALMGDSIGEFGNDTGETFPDLLNALCDIDDKVQIALNNFHPKFFLKHKTELLNLLEKNRIRHINIPIQSASTKILAQMKRGYSKEDIIEIFNLLNRFIPKNFDTHIIVGFPGEADDDINETIDFLYATKPAYVLASGYMESPQADSAQFPGKISDEEKISRLQKVQMRLSSTGIIVNADGSDLAVDRINRVLKN